MGRSGEKVPAEDVELRATLHAGHHSRPRKRLLVHPHPHTNAPLTHAHAAPPHGTPWHVHTRMAPRKAHSRAHAAANSWTHPRTHPHTRESTS